MPFHGWGFGTNPLRHLALLDTSSPEGGAFCALSPAGRGTILNGLRCALAMFSGKIILNFRVCRTLRSATDAFFHRRGRSRELHLQRLLPTEARRCGGTPLPAFALSLQACKKLPLSVELANAVSLRGFPRKRATVQIVQWLFFMRSVLGFTAAERPFWPPVPEWRRGGSG